MTAQAKPKTGDGRRKTSAGGGGTKRAAKPKATASRQRTTPDGKGQTTTGPSGGTSAQSEQQSKNRTEPSATARAAAGWNPRIVVFACNWCSYAGADTAGVSRIQHQPHFRMIRVMCSGRIQPAFVLRAFEKGADGVLVSGCHFGDCHYIFGNERAVEQFAKTVNMIKLLGIEQGRLRLEWISAAEGARFAQVINEFTDQVRELGPSPFARSDSIEQLIVEAEEVA